MEKKSLQKLWRKLTTPHSTDEVEVRQEYMTKVTLVIANTIMLVATPLALIGTFFGILTSTFPIISIIATAFLIIGLWLAYQGFWRVGGYILLAVVYANALYNNYIDGAGTTAIAYYAVVIVLSAMLLGVNAMWVALVLGLGGYILIGWAHVQGYLAVMRVPASTFVNFALDIIIAFVGLTVLLWFLITQLQRALTKSQVSVAELSEYKATLEDRVTERTTALEASMVEQERLQQQIIETQQQALKELSSPVIPIINTSNGKGGIIVMPLVGNIDSMRAGDITRALLAGISRYRASVVILDITGVSVIDSGVAGHLNKTVQAARLKGAHTIITGISDAVAESIIELGIDWSNLTTRGDLQTGLTAGLNTLGFKIEETVN